MTNTQYYSHTCYVWHSVYQLLISNTLKIMMCAGLPQQQNQLSYTVLKAIYISLTLLHHRTKHIKKHKVINIEKKGSHAIDSSQIMHFKNQALYEIRLVGFFSPAEQLICPPKIQKNREPSQTNFPKGAMHFTNNKLYQFTGNQCVLILVTNKFTTHFIYHM